MDNHISRCIVREPLPPAIPRGTVARLVWWERLWCQFAADAATTLGELRANGWTEDLARKHIQGYSEWVSGNVAHSVEMALFMAELEAV